MKLVPIHDHVSEPGLQKFKPTEEMDALLNVSEPNVLLGRLTTGEGGHEELNPAALTEETAPAAGDFLPIWTGDGLRKVDFSEFGGGSGSPGGSSTQMQYNNAGSFDGAAGLTVDGSENILITQAVSLSGDITPSALSGTNNDYSPTGLSTAAVIRQDVSSGAILTGIAGGADGRVLVVHNISTSNSLSILNENSSSTAANRLILGGGDITLRAGGTATFIYDATSNRWRIVSISNFSGSSIVHEYTTPQTNTSLSIPSGAKWAHITCVGAGGGGGSGRKGVAGIIRGGGGGGGAGGSASTMYTLEGGAISTFYVNVGTGGTGGAGQSTNSTNGNAGTAGGDSDVRADGTATTDRIIRAQGGNLGGAGVQSGGGAGGSSTGLISDMVSASGASGNSSGGAGNTGGSATTRCPGGGAAAGGITSGNSASAGGAGGSGYLALQSGGAADGGAPAALALNRESGGGGGGGNASTSGNATSGGNGVRGGGGGGGGAAVDSVGNSGAGGAGGDGYVKIVFGW